MPASSRGSIRPRGMGTRSVTSALEGSSRTEVSTAAASSGVRGGPFANFSFPRVVPSGASQPQSQQSQSQQLQSQQPQSQPQQQPQRHPGSHLSNQGVAGTGSSPLRQPIYGGRAPVGGSSRHSELVGVLLAGHAHSCSRKTSPSRRGAASRGMHRFSKSVSGSMGPHHHPNFHNHSSTARAMEATRPVLNKDGTAATISTQTPQEWGGGGSALKRGTSSIAAASESELHGHPGAPPSKQRAPKKRKTWRRILWVEQDYPDNFVDSSFLSRLITNGNVREYYFVDVSLGSLALLQQVSIVCIFAVLYALLYSGEMDPTNMCVASAFMVTAGYGLTWVVTRPTVASTVEIFQRFSVVIFTAAALSPVLSTLTRPFAADTIWALTFIFTGIHLYSCDYAHMTHASGSGKPRHTVALNSALLASVVLASRLPTALHTFALVTFSMVMFGLSPSTRREVYGMGPWFHVGLTLLLAAPASYLLYSFHPPAAVAFLAVAASLVILIPFWLVWVQKYKNEIRGPWDVAIPQPLNMQQ